MTMHGAKVEGLSVAATLSLSLFSLSLSLSLSLAALAFLRLSDPTVDGRRRRRSSGGQLAARVGEWGSLALRTPLSSAVHESASGLQSFSPPGSAASPRFTPRVAHVEQRQEARRRRGRWSEARFR